MSWSILISKNILTPREPHRWLFTTVYQFRGTNTVAVCGIDYKNVCRCVCVYRWGCLCLQITRCRPSVALLPADPNHTISVQQQTSTQRKHISQHDRLLTPRPHHPGDYQLLLMTTTRTFKDTRSTLHKITWSFQVWQVCQYSWLPSPPTFRLKKWEINNLDTSLLFGTGTMGSEGSRADGATDYCNGLFCN